MNGDSEKTTTTNQNTSTQYPDWTQPAGQNLFNTAANWVANNPTRPTYTGDMQGAFGSTYQPAKDYLSGMLGQVDPSTQAAAGAATSAIGSLDPNKSVQDYINPYVGATLQPTLQNLAQTFQDTGRGTGSQATMAGAFGDTGHQALQAVNDKNYGDSVAGATATAYGNAFNAATTQKNSVLSQLLQGATTAAGVGQNAYAQQTGDASMLAGLGSTEQQANQQGVTNNLAQFNAGVQYPMQNMTTLAAILRGIPLNTTGTSSGTSVSTQPDNSGMALGGALLSYLL